MATKKLIEVALPLEKINAESAHEKSVRHGHPSTLHLWWARRPLAAARAVIWSSLVDDPSSHPELFPTEESQSKERQRLFKILEELVVWENSNNQDILRAAKEEIIKPTNGNPPALLDPFAGGGAIPLEAQRLGLEAYANDLNPVAVMINKAMIEIPPIFSNQPPVNNDDLISRTKNSWQGAQGLAADINYYGNWVVEEAYKKLKGYYPDVKLPSSLGGGTAKVIAWIWARTTKCQDPACNCQVPLVGSYIVSNKKGKEAWVEPQLDGDEIKFIVHKGKCPKDKESPKQGRSAVFKCPKCGEVTSDSYVKQQGREHNIKSKMMCIAAEGTRGRIYLSPDIEQELAAEVERPLDFPMGEMPDNPRWFSPPAFGYTDYSDLFTNRQMFSLLTFCEIISSAQKKVEEDALLAGMPNDHISLSNGGSGAFAYSQAIQTYLAFSLDKCTNRCGNLCAWKPGVQCPGDVFGRQAIPMVWDYAEANIFGPSGSFESMYKNVIAGLISTDYTFAKNGHARQNDAQTDCGLRGLMISTDPPYYDNIGYADLSDYFYIWMRQNLKNVYPDIFKTMLVPKKEELIATPYRHNGSSENAKKFFEQGMAATCSQLYMYAGDDYPVTIYYAYKQSDTVLDSDTKKTSSSGWETMLEAIIRSGFVITGTWPVRTERANREIAQGTNALASSIVLVCRKRSDDAPQTTRRNLINILRRELRPALKEASREQYRPGGLGTISHRSRHGCFLSLSEGS